MNRERILPFIGFGLLLVCFCIALVRVFHREHTEGKDGRITIRIAHWQLEAGIRDAFDSLARDYERLHPGVHIEQAPIPERIYTSWLQTQLVGGTAPDLIEIGHGSTDEMLSRYFVPITDQMEQPNPYNLGTPLADTRWRDTFVDGLAGGESYKPNLLEYYGVPMSIFTIRMYYNINEWKRILGDTPVPATYDDFVSLCQRIQQHSAATGDNIVPIAGSQYGVPLFINSLIGNQTQRLAQRIDDLHSLKPSNQEVALKFLAGDWRIDSPDFVNGLALSRQIGLFAQPGFVQAARDDATFYFMQGRALMIVTGSWDAPSFRALAPFDIGVFRLPLPLPSDPRYGAGVLGPASEADTATGTAFGLTKASTHPAEALDFLHYITSQPGNATFSRVSSWLPSVVGVELSPRVKPFAPILDGYVNGFGLAVGGGSDVSRIINTNIGLIFDANSDLPSIEASLAALLPDAVRTDLLRSVHQIELNTARQDTLLAAQLILHQHHPANPEYARKQNEILEAQTLQELGNAWIVRQTAPTP